MTDDCCFCAELAGARTEFHDLYPGFRVRIALEAENFILLPSLGPLAPGHMLLLTRQHVSSFGRLDPVRRREARAVYSAARQLIARVFSPAVCFEHGSPPGATAGGCGILHAHVHLVPLRGRDDPLPLSVGDGWHQPRGADWLDHVAALAGEEEGYLLWHGPNAEPRIEVVREVASQYLRRHVATLLGHRRWDWRRTGPQRELVATLRALSTASLPPGFVRP